MGNSQQVCVVVFGVGTVALKTSLQIQDSNNADVLLDSGFKLSDIIVILCSKLLDYILLMSGSISGSYYILFRE